MKEPHKPGGFDSRNGSSHSSRDRKPEVKVSAGLAPSVAERERPETASRVPWLRGEAPS